MADLGNNQTPSTCSHLHWMIYLRRECQNFASEAKALGWKGTWARDMAHMKHIKQEILKEFAIHV